MAESKKKRMSIWVILGIISFCLVIVAVTVAIEQKMNPIRQNETTPDAIDQTKLTVVSTSVKPHIAGSGYWEVVGEIKNNDNSLYYDANFTIDIYGRNKELIATAFSNISNVGPGETKSFWTTTSYDVSEYSDMKVHFDLLRPYK